MACLCVCEHMYHELQASREVVMPTVWAVTVQYVACGRVLCSLWRAAHFVARGARRPRTCSSRDLKYVLDKIDIIQIMSVNPGFGGQSLIEGVFPKMERIRKRIDQLGLDTLIEVDGGVKTHNAHQFTAAGAHALVSGSGVFGAEDRVAAIAALKAS